MTPEKCIEEVLREHGRDRYGFCDCGWEGDNPGVPNHAKHAASAVAEALGGVFYKRGRYFFGEVLNADHPGLPFVKCLCGAEFTAEATR